MLTSLSKTRHGVEYARIVEAYHGEDGRPRQRIVERHGRLDKLIQADDPGALDKPQAPARELTGSWVLAARTCASQSFIITEGVPIPALTSKIVPEDGYVKSA